MMFKMNQLAVGLFLFLSSLFSCQQKGDFKSMNVDDFDNLIQNEDIQRLDVRTLAEYSEGHIAKTININVMDDSFASMADSLLQKDKPVAVYCRSGKRSKKGIRSLNLIRDSILGRRQARRLSISRCGEKYRF